jgi:hypothetical protein
MVAESLMKGGIIKAHSPKSYDDVIQNRIRNDDVEISQTTEYRSKHRRRP